MDTPAPPPMTMPSSSRHVRLAHLPQRKVQRVLLPEEAAQGTRPLSPPLDKSSQHLLLHISTEGCHCLH